jgi:hypothetical protein
MRHMLDVDQRASPTIPTTFQECLGRPCELFGIDETLCQHVGSLFDNVDRHDHHRNTTSPLVHHLECRGWGQASLILRRGACHSGLHRCIHYLLREDLVMLQTYLIPVVQGCLLRPRRRHMALLVGMALSVGLISRAQAATTWTVCAIGCTYTNIKAAIAAPTTLNGDTLAIAAGTYTEPGISVDKSLTLQGAGATSTFVQAAATRGAANDRVFSIPSSVTVTLQDLTIRYGHAVEGGGIRNSGTLTLSQCTVSDNRATERGGGLFNYAGTLPPKHSTVSCYKADYIGGGLHN